MDGLALTWLFRAALFAVAFGIGIGYLVQRPRAIMVPLRTSLAGLAVLVNLWQVYDRPNATGGFGFSDPLRWTVGVFWVLVATLLIIEGIHAIRIRKVRNGTEARLVEIINGEHAA